MKGLSIRCVALLCAVASATLAAVEVWPSARDVRTQDRNGDGRPDIWRHYDDKGLLTHVAVDSNFDGRPDIEEYYRRGALVRRESDRNFNGQADLVEEFDEETRAETRSVVDVDYDGIADLLVLFRDGRPVFLARAWSTGSQIPDTLLSIVREGGGSHLVPLFNPFESDLTVRAIHAAPNTEGWTGLATAGGQPCPPRAAAGRLSASARVLAGDTHARSLTPLPRCSPRAPPVSTL